MSRFRFGVGDQAINARHSPTAVMRAGYLTAVATGADSFWVPDHLNALLPRSIWTAEYVGGTRLVPKVDANLEPWTMLGHLAARNRIGRLRLGVSVTDAGCRNPAGHRAGSRYAASAHPRAGNTGHRDRRARRQPTLRRGLDQAGRAVRRGDRHHPRVVGLGWRTRHARLAVLPAPQRIV